MRACHNNLICISQLWTEQGRRRWLEDQLDQKRDFDHFWSSGNLCQGGEQWRTVLFSINPSVKHEASKSYLWMYLLSYSSDLYSKNILLWWDYQHLVLLHLPATPTRDHGDSCSSESKQCVGKMSTPIKETWSLVNKSNSPDRGAVGDNFGDGRCDLAPVRDSRLDVGLNRNRNNKRQPRNQRHRSNKSKQTDPRCLHTEGQGVDMPL